MFNATHAVKKLNRVLKRDGLVYVEIPFLQGFHATINYPNFQRYTIMGIQELFREVKVVDEGIVTGPSSALSWILREILAILFSFNSVVIYRILNLILGWLPLPLKYLDYFLEKNKAAHVIASGFFSIGKK